MTKRRFSALAECGEPRRNTSSTLLTERVRLVAEQWGRCQNLSGPEQCVILKLKGIKEMEAKKLVVEVVFKAASQKPTLSLNLTSWDEEGLQTAWSMAVTAVELSPGMHFFHFRVNGAFALSGEHIRIGRCNARPTSSLFVGERQQWPAVRGRTDGREDPIQANW